MGSVCSAIGRAINSVISAIASVFMAIVGGEHHERPRIYLELLPRHHLLPMRLSPTSWRSYKSEEILVDAH
ncbi:unnamed protein product [Rhizoctonia solani]|uniref:Uncharacterized protein n=1 Tax=Rhizoctonia solani TaxID=456999 RepID=A0A8H3DZ39_9AGAM|nr:unnamed protein product [Rhizoctonia solani]